MPTSIPRHVALPRKILAKYAAYKILSSYAQVQDHGVHRVGRSAEAGGNVPKQLYCELNREQALTGVQSTRTSMEHLLLTHPLPWLTGVILSTSRLRKFLFNSYAFLFDSFLIRHGDWIPVLCVIY